MALQIFEKVFPIFAAIFLGSAARRFRWLSPEEIKGMKNLVGSILLPVVLFNAFFTASYSGKTLLCFFTIFLVMTAALAVNFLLRRFNPKFGKYMPLLMTGWEGGMLGYALYGLIYGSANTQNFAVLDMGQTLFSFTVLVTVLGIADGVRPDPAVIVKNMFASPGLCGMLAGTVLGAVGLGRLVTGSFLGGTYSSVIYFITAPTSCLILLSIGYEFSLKREILKPVLVTSILRLAVMACACAVTALVIFAFNPFDKELLVAMMVGLSLPAPFIIPIYIKDSSQADYVSTTLSVGTLLAMVCFVAITAFAMVH